VYARNNNNNIKTNKTNFTDVFLLANKIEMTKINKTITPKIP
jgi:hypothetical protein